MGSTLIRFLRRRPTRAALLAGVVASLLTSLGAPLLPLERGQAQSDAPLVELNEETLKRHRP